MTEDLTDGVGTAVQLFPGRSVEPAWGVAKLWLSAQVVSINVPQLKSEPG